ncbi:MAG TPA: methyl-accepting chemotaxis protein [Syntrophobacteraceae bacterium]|nr:methyl-accepting chemotaxis protein [Syntrophobacteraceae bacterium]
MKIFSRGIAGKILGGSTILILVGVVVGGAGYISLDRVIRAGNMSTSANDVQAKILEARVLEKEFILTKDKQVYEKLVRTLGELEKSSSQLLAAGTESRGVEEIRQAGQVYEKAAAELKRLEEEDAAVLTELQKVAASISSIAAEESSKALAKTKSDILQANTETLREYSREKIRGVVSVGHDVLKHYHDVGISQAAALDALRNMHFDGDNYFFVVQENLTLVAHGSNRKLEGMDFGKIQDKKTGKTFMREVVDAAMKDGESLTEYYWTKPGAGEAIFPKLTYGKYFKPWGLIVCAGVYVDDIEKQIHRTAGLFESGIDRLQQANAINDLTLQARLNALYYFAFATNAEKVAEKISLLTNLKVATDALKKDAGAYLEKFNQRVANNEKRRQEIGRINEAAERTLKASTGISSGAMDTFGKSVSGGKGMIIAFILVGLVGGFVLAFFLARGITHPINRAMAGIEEASEQVRAASEQVESASQELAEGSSEQAASLEETSSALEQMAAMTRQNADNANEATKLMAESGRVVEQANQSMSLLTASMGQITEASEQTQKIIKTIDEIAFQTNLLALNAAVEAARAGEAGAGFAVVADEVRNLAMRAAEAAKNTADLIEGTVKRIKEGSQLVEKTNAEFNQVTGSVIKSGELVREIAAASQEQSQGIGQVSHAVAEMDKVTQKSASSAEESASASQQMKAQAVQLRGYVEDLARLVGGTVQGALSLSGKEKAAVTRVLSVSAAPPSPVPGAPPQRKGNGKALLSAASLFRRGKTQPLLPQDDHEYRDF